MDAVRVNITGDRQVGLRFEQFPDELYAALKAEISALALELFARIEAATPSRTGALRAEERVRLFADPNRITGYVDIAAPDGKDAAKAGALEYGAHRPTEVRAHTMNHLFARPMTVMLQAYTRTPNVPAFAFERGPLAEMQPEVAARLNAVVEKRVAETNT